ncbi:MAG: 50S ribosomal protein L24 [Limisphaerales bacterium]
MATAHIKKGDEVVVIAGSELGGRGKILLINKKKQRALVEGLKMIKRHTRKNDKRPQGGIVEREGTIHISNLMLASKYDGKRGGAAAPAEGAAQT